MGSGVDVVAHVDEFFHSIWLLFLRTNYIRKKEGRILLCKREQMLVDERVGEGIV